MSWTRAALIAVGLGLGVAMAGTVAEALEGDVPDHDRSTVSSARAPTRAPTAAAAETLGRSVRGRPITEWTAGDPAASARVLVFGVIHGNEPGGTAVTRALRGLMPPSCARLVVVDRLNPDGVAANRRQNAHGVDLNRNFPWRWKATGRRGDQQYPGPRALSEPESRVAAVLITQLRPTITIWFHQTLNVVDLSGGDPAIERRYARLAGMRTRRLTRYHGSAASWENHALPGSTAFVVELGHGTLSTRAASRHANAILTLARSVGGC